MAAENLPIFLEETRSSKPDREFEISSEPSYHLAFRSFDTDLRKLLVEVTGATDAESITTVKIKVATKQAGLHRLADYTPRLKVLVLDGSCVDTLRDLGSSLKRLENLSVVGCNLKSLDGLWAFRKLNTLIARDNFIKDPSPCSGVRKLAKLDLANNEIDDYYSFAFLRNCKYLKILEVYGNRFEHYKDTLTNLLPQIRNLDGEDIDAVDNEEHEGDFGEESDSASEAEEFVFFSDNEENNPKEKEAMNFALKKYAELGAGDDKPIILELKENCEKHFADEFTKTRAYERNLDSSSTSVFLMTHEFDSISMIERNATTVDCRRGLEVTPGKLTSGRAICGNLAASLRARNLSKNPFGVPTALVEFRAKDTNEAKN